MTLERRWSQIAFFAAFCLFLSGIEYAIPKPLPFMRLGLANLPILLAVQKMDWRDFLLLIICKVLGQSFISGTTFSYIFLFSLSGSFASGMVILAVHTLCRGKKRADKAPISFIGLSLAGSLANNAAQLLCARYLLFGSNTRYIAPLLLLSGLATGLLLGIFANQFSRQSIWYRHCFESDGFSVTETPPKRFFLRNMLFFLFIVVIASLSFIQNLAILWGVVLGLFFLALWRKKGKIRILPPLGIVVTVTLMSLLSPYGKILFTLGSWQITQGALYSGLHKSAVLIGMVFASQCIISRNIALPGKAGVIIATIFRIGSLLAEKRLSFKPGTIISSLDSHLIEIQKQL